MKKVYMIMGVATAIFAACSEDYTNWTAPQSNPQTPEKTISFTATPLPAVDYNTIKGDSLQLFTSSVLTEATLVSQKFSTVVFNENKTRQKVLKTTKEGKIAAADLENAVKNLYGEGDTERAVSITINDTINVETGESFVKTFDFTCKVSLTKKNFPEFFYVVNPEKPTEKAQVLRGEKFDGTFIGYVYLDKQFKLRPNSDNAENDLECTSEGNVEEKGQGEACIVSTPAFYKIEVKLEQGVKKGTYTLTKIDNVSIIGDAVGGWDKDFIDLTYNPTTGIWGADNVNVIKTGPLKFRANHGWALSWGGYESETAFNELTANNGKNLNVEKGTYKVELTLTFDGKSKVVFTKK